MKEVLRKMATKEKPIITMERLLHSRRRNPLLNIYLLKEMARRIKALEKANSKKK